MNRYIPRISQLIQAHAGYVGTGMLTAAVAGKIFASPSTKQILTGLRAIESKAGTLIIVKNYTGDVLHFGLAAERAKAGGLQIEMVVVADDVSVGRQKGSLVGRRGLAGTILVHKISGALAEQGYIPSLSSPYLIYRESLEKIAATANNVIENLVTLGFSLDHCSVPGRTSEEFLAANEVEIGMGIHNEPGVNRLRSIPTSSELASKALKLLLDQNDPDRAFVPFSPGDKMVLLVNNLGSISNLELSAFAGLVFDQLGLTYGLSPVRVYTGTFMTALNGPGASVTLLNLSRLKDSKTVLAALDAKTTALGWSGNVVAWDRVGKLDLRPSPPEQTHEHVVHVSTDPATLTKILKGAADALIKAEPEITKYDTIGISILESY
jgi:triose/dihydroxyacetone kinase / FAD-AMP lyase (cyclizing)